MLSPRTQTANVLHYVWYTILQMKGHYVHPSHVINIVDMPVIEVYANRSAYLDQVTCDPDIIQSARPEEAMSASRSADVQPLP